MTARRRDQLTAAAVVVVALVAAAVFGRQTDADGGTHSPPSRVCFAGDWSSSAPRPCLTVRVAEDGSAAITAHHAAASDGGDGRHWTAP
jgi:hypothetical protein